MLTLGTTSTSRHNARKRIVFTALYPPSGRRGPPTEPLRITVQRYYSYALPLDLRPRKCMIRFFSSGS